MEVLRLSSGKDSTVGVLRFGNFVCWTCEDEYRAVKVAGETRIPDGRYKIKLRTEGGMHEKYKAKYAFHRGMLWLQGVAGFEYVYIHVGNTDDDTLGCILVGFDAQLDSRDGGGAVSRSVEAYSALYKIVAPKIEAGEEVWVTLSTLS